MIFHKILETLLCKVVEFKLDLKQARLKVQRTRVLEVERLYGQVVVYARNTSSEKSDTWYKCTLVIHA